MYTIMYKRDMLLFAITTVLLFFIVSGLWAKERSLNSKITALENKVNPVTLAVPTPLATTTATTAS